MRRIYIAGKMSGVADFNYPAFHAAAIKLRDMGYAVECPAENPTPPCGGTWEGWLKQAIRQMLTCDTVALLDGWETSRGANLEVSVARQLGMTIKSIREFV